MELPITGPSNRFLVRERDRRWPYVLTAVLLAAGVLLGVLCLMGWPRLKATSIHYDLIRLRAQVEELGRRERSLAAELEQARNPARLAARAEELGLERPRALAAAPADEESP